MLVDVDYPHFGLDAGQQQVDRLLLHLIVLGVLRQVLFPLGLLPDLVRLHLQSLYLIVGIALLLRNPIQSPSPDFLVFLLRLHRNKVVGL